MWFSGFGRWRISDCPCRQPTAYGRTLLQQSLRSDALHKWYWITAREARSNAACELSSGQQRHQDTSSVTATPQPATTAPAPAPAPAFGAPTGGHIGGSPASRHNSTLSRVRSPNPKFRHRPHSAPRNPPALPSTSNPTLATSDPRALLRTILNCQDLDTLLLLLLTHEPSLNVRHLDAALDRLGRLATAAPAAAAARLCGGRLLSSILLTAPAAAAAAAALTPRDCASLLSALARLELRPPPAVAALLQFRLLEQLPASSVRDVAALLHGCVRLRLALPEGAVPELLCRLDGELARAGKPQDVSMVLWSLASLEPSLSQPLPASPSSSPSPTPEATSGPASSLDLEPWLTRLTAQLSASRLVAAFPPQALSNIAWAMARLGYVPRPEWLGGLVAGSGRRLQFFSTPELVNLVWALAVMRHRPGAAWLARALGLLRDRAPNMTPQDVSCLCWSLAMLRVRPGLPLLQRLVARALALRKELGPQSLVNTLWGLSRLRVLLPERAVALLIHGGMGAAAMYGTGGLASGSGGRARGPSAGAGELGPQPQPPPPAPPPPPPRAGVASRAAARPGDLAGVALVLAHCRHVPPRRWQVRWCGAVRRQLHLFGPRELSTLMYAIGRLGPMGLRLEPHWLDRVLTEVERLAEPSVRQAQSPSPQHSQTPTPPERLDAAQLSILLWAVARLGHQPPGAWLAAMARRVAARAEEFGPRDAATTIRALQELAAAAADKATARRTPALRHLSDGSSSSDGSLSRSSGGGSSSSDGILSRSSSGGGSSSGGKGSRNRRLRGRREASISGSSSGLDDCNSSSGSSSSTSGSSSSSSNGCCPCGEAVAALVTRLAASLPEHSWYGTLRAVSLSRGGMSYATVADQLLTDVYSVKSLGLLHGGGGTA